jgi:hypothetical protein
MSLLAVIPRSRGSAVHAAEHQAAARSRIAAARAIRDCGRRGDGHLAPRPSPRSLSAGGWASRNAGGNRGGARRRLPSRGCSRRRSPMISPRRLSLTRSAPVRANRRGRLAGASHDQAAARPTRSRRRSSTSPTPCRAASTRWPRRPTGQPIAFAPGPTLPSASRSRSRDALLLDKACQRAGGGTPIAEYYLGRLKAAGALAPADSDCLARHAARVVRECGEAGAALFEAAQPGSTPAQRVEARREVDEALEVLKRAVPMLVGHDAFEKMCVGSGHQSTGPPH